MNDEFEFKYRPDCKRIFHFLFLEHLHNLHKQKLFLVPQLVNIHLPIDKKIKLKSILKIKMKNKCIE